jgi:hypothetical protein
MVRTPHSRSPQEGFTFNPYKITAEESILEALAQANDEQATSIFYNYLRRAVRIGLMNIWTSLDRTKSASQSARNRVRAVKKKQCQENLVGTLYLQHTTEAESDVPTSGGIDSAI